MKGRRIRLGTRGSKLALKQTEILERHIVSSGIAVEKIIISTSGDMAQNGMVVCDKSKWIDEIEHLS